MTLTVPTRRKAEMVDITDQVSAAIRDAGVENGVCMVYTPHTTAGVTINESADPDVARDVLMALDRIAPENLNYRHAEGNSPAHVKSSLMGCSQLVAVSGGRPVLGTWQGVFFCEFDGPRTRKVHLFFL